jgi:hypothetical protein
MTATRLRIMKKLLRCHHLEAAEMMRPVQEIDFPGPKTEFGVVRWQRGEKTFAK